MIVDYLERINDWIKWHFRFSHLKWFIQRGRRGWADCDVWSFDTYLASVIAGGVKHLKEIEHGHPADITRERWHEILNDIIFAFEALKDQPFVPPVWEPRFEPYPFSMPEDLYDRIKRGQALFAEYFQGLWD